MSESTTRSWTDIEPKDAVDLNLAVDLSIDAPLNEMGERCPWPWEPQQLVGAPLGQFHCQYCGAMCVAGMPHFDYRDTTRTGVVCGRRRPVSDEPWCGCVLPADCDGSCSSISLDD